MSLHPVVAAVTDRIRERSREGREAYLRGVDAMSARERGADRMGCANVAHAFAALPGDERFKVVAERAPNQTLRAWVPGCATGEEAYSLAILLHDIGWYSIDMEDIIEKGFGPNMMQSDVRFLHESEGVRLSRPLLVEAGWSEAVIAAVAEIIDGHDTRAVPHHLNDRLVRDADKLWRFSVTGVAVACDWFKMTPRQYADRLVHQVASLETETGRGWAAAELQATRAALMLHLI